MSYKRTLLECFASDQLKRLCDELEVDADRRSSSAMIDALAGSRRVKPETIVDSLTVQQLREALSMLGEPTAGRREDLVGRVLAAGGRVVAENGDPNVSANDAATLGYRDEPAAARGRALRMGEDAAQYRHLDEAVQRPDAGVQDQFQSRKPPRTYRYDSSIDPALAWDEQRERDLGEWLLGLIVRAAKEGEGAVFAEPQQWKGGGVRIATLAEAAQMLQSISQPYLNWAGKAERRELKVPTVPLFVHERHSTKAILDGIRHRKARGQTLDLFGDSGMDIRENLEAYEHRGPWQNRMILGDSLSVMNSLLEFEGMAGQVQMIFIDPPYGVKFGSNFQPFVRKRDVKHSGDEDMTREPEMVKAYRDTWDLGLHSYLAYLRDRLLVARELLRDTGSVFVQISDDNVHLVRQILDEVFGLSNAVVTVAFKKKSSTTPTDPVNDYLLWYAKDRGRIKVRPLFARRTRPEDDPKFNTLVSPTGEMKRIRTLEEAEVEQLLTDGWRWARVNWPLVSQDENDRSRPFVWNGRSFDCGRNRHWTFDPEVAMPRLAREGRLFDGGGRSLGGVVYWDDWPFVGISNFWDDIHGDPNPIYVVQTSYKVVQRCVLMTTDPGDLVLDPTCGSGTTAYVSEHWGRRWITIDTSRVPLALARQRLLTATFPYFELKSPRSGPSGGFVYRRKNNRKGEEIGGLVPRITLKSIANDEPPEMETLVDRPEEVSGVTRVAGPFVVEATIAPVQPLESSGDSAPSTGDVASHIQRMTEVLRQSKTLRLPGNRVLVLGGVRRTTETEYLHAEAIEGDRRVAVVFGPADGAVSATLVFEAAREAWFLKYERLYFFGFAIEPGARALVEDERKLRIPASYVAVTPDVAMSDLLKTTRASEIFSVTGLPDAAVRKTKRKGPEGQTLYEVELRGLDTFDPESMGTESVSGNDVPCWMLDSDYDGMSFYATQVFFPRTSAWDNLQRSLGARFEDSVWTHLAGTVSEPFALGERRRVAVKVIDERGNELIRVLDVTE